MEQNKITIIKNNSQFECIILFTFNCTETGKTYIGYSDDIPSKNGKKNIYISSCDMHDNSYYLEDIKTSEENEMIKEVLSAIYKESI